VVDSVAGVYEARLRKRLQFQRRVVPELGRALTKGGTSVGFAFAGLGAWSLVAGQVASSLVAALLYWSVSQSRPRLEFDWSIARALCRYGAQYAMFALLAVAIKDVDYLVIGRRMTADDLGYYTLAFRLPELAILGTCYVFSATLFPIFAKLQMDPLRLAAAFARAVRLLLLATLPLGVGMSLVSPELVRVVFSEKWIPAVPALRWLALYASVTAVSFIAGDVYKAVGRTGLLNVLALGRLALTAPVIWLATTHGIEGVAGAQFAVACLVAAVEVIVVLRILEVTLVDFILKVLPAIGSAVIMAGAVLVSRWLLAGGSPLVRLTMFVAIGACSYAAATWFLARSAVLDLLHSRGTGARRRVST
ncbi:MAG: oligosaccharide flippase family protein, partial [Chloroflexota bacterium]|nr:oligosaccharide flippase family protein [Chloroflexota bacterium]